MEGWTEEEIKNTDLMAPCGLYCGACGIYIATRDGNKKFQAILGNLYGTKPEETACLGCMQPDPPQQLYGYCSACKIRDCVKIENFPLATGLRVIKRAIPEWREIVAARGDEKGSREWARKECERYHCSSCGSPLFRGAQSCRACHNPVAEKLDGSI